MPLPWIVLAAASAAGVGATPEFRAFRTCIARTMGEAARANATPEDLPVALRSACPEERTALEEIVRRGSDGSAADLARRMEAATGPLLDGQVRRYQIYYATGAWPKS